MDFSVQEAKNQLSHLLELAERGERVIIRRHGKPVAQLSAVVASKRKLGAEAHLPPFPNGWEKPMSKDEADAFLGTRT